MNEGVSRLHVVETLLQCGMMLRGRAMDEFTAWRAGFIGRAALSSTGAIPICLMLGCMPSRCRCQPLDP